MAGVLCDGVEGDDAMLAVPARVDEPAALVASATLPALLAAPLPPPPPSPPPLSILCMLILTGSCRGDMLLWCCCCCCCCCCTGIGGYCSIWVGYPFGIGGGLVEYFWRNCGLEYCCCGVLWYAGGIGCRSDMFGGCCGCCCWGGGSCVWIRWGAGDRGCWGC